MKIIVEEGITHISQAGFWHMPYLESAEIAESVVSIGDYAFYGAPLTIVIPTGWVGDTDANLLPTGLRSIGSFAFSETQLDNITLPYTLETLATYAGIIVSVSQHVDNPNQALPNDLDSPYGTYVTDMDNTSALVICSLPDGAIAWNLRYRRATVEGEQEMRWVVQSDLTTRSYTIENLRSATTYEVRMQVTSQLAIDLSLHRAEMGEVRATGVAIDETTFPDENFRKWVLSQKYGKDGILTEEEIAEVETVDVAYQDIKSLKGIEYFTAMEYLLCGGEHLTETGISKNTNLKWLRCSQSKLTSLDVSKNAVLEELRCHNNQLTALDVSNNPLLENLDCESNKLTELDVSHNPKLKYLSCYYNLLTSLDVSQNPALESLNCYELPLGTLDVTKNPALQSLVCTGMQLTTLDLSQNPELNYLSCDGNDLTTLDLTQNPKLYFLRCYGNKLSVLDVTKNPVLEIIECYRNQLTALDVTQNPKLKELECNDNQIAALDVTKNTKLESMNCGGNPIKTLNVSQNTGLKRLYCWGNQLAALDLSKNVALTDLACHLNTIKGEAMDALIEILPTITDQFLGNWHVIYSNDEGNVITTTQVAAAKAKGWKPMYFDSYWKPYDGSDPTSIKAMVKQTLNDSLYDLQGRKVTAPRKGIYIQNGKLYIVK